MERLLIKRVKENDFLYDPNSTHYRDIEVRQRTWEKIGKELDLRAEEARSTWDKLRRCFINARNRRRLKENVSGITIHPWKYEKDMAFVWPFVEKNRKSHAYNKPDDNTTYKHIESEDSEDAEKDLTHEDATTDSIDNIKMEFQDSRLQDYTSPQPDASVSVYENEDITTVIEETNKIESAQDNNLTEKIDYNRKFTFQESSLLQMDECDLFFMSMSKMTKSLPVLERAKVKLAVSNAVLQELIAVHGHVNPS